MQVLGAKYIIPLLVQTHFSAKMVFNSHGAIIFPVTQEHRNQTALNISYEDNYKGNAMAAMLSPNMIEIRYHNAFTDKQVSEIISVLQQQPELDFMAKWKATYQGRLLA